MMEAQKLKKKFNGTVLKGAKVKIEEAKPERKKRKSEEAVDEVPEEKAARKKAKKEKRKIGEKVIPGHELPAGRHIKRGWTEDKAKSKKPKKDGQDEGLEDKKLKFKTVLPPNKASGVKEGKKSKTEEKKTKDLKNSKKEFMVKEFEKAKKPQDGGAKPRKTALTYEEGAGWVDEDGKVKEPEPPSKKRRRENEKSTKKTEPAARVRPDPIVEEAPELDSEPEDDKIELAHAGLLTREEWSGDEDTASSPTVSSESSVSSDSESESDNSEDALDEQLARAKSNTVSNKNTQTPEPSQSQSLAVGDVQEADMVTEKEIHPLEALFKRKPEDATKPKPAPIDTSFSFFNSGVDEEDDTGITELRPPQTPHTKEDLEWRSIRSAAPTPDTAAIGKRFDFSFSRDDEDADEEMRDESPVRAGVERAQKDDGTKDRGEESEFRKWFYENRGDLNRAWKKRRREEKKVVRQRENRRFSRRVA